MRELILDDPAPGTHGTTAWATATSTSAAAEVHLRPDVLVVGAGVAGLATASALVDAGAGVVQVVDRGPVAGGATGRNAGALIPDVHALVVDEDEAALGRRGLARHRELAPVLGHPLHALTWLAVHESPPPSARMAASGARWLEGPEAVAAATAGQVHATAGALVPGQAATDPVALATALADRVGRVTTGVAVTRIGHDDGLVVDTTAGRLRPGAVVLATGTVPSGWLPTRRRWVTGHLVLTAPVADWPADLAAARAVVVVPRRDGRLLVGGTRDGERVDGRVDEAVVAAIRAELTSLVPAAADVAFERVWTGQRPVVDDDLPLLDDVADDVLVVGGLFHTGVLTCLAVADAVVARLGRGAWPDWARAFHRRA